MADMQHNRDLCGDVICSTIKGCTPRTPFIQELVDTAFGVDNHLWVSAPTLLTEIDYIEETRRLEHPVLILHGCDDFVLDPAASERLGQMLRNGTCRLVPGHGHSLNVEDPEKFAALCGKFLWPALHKAYQPGAMSAGT